MDIEIGYLDSSIVCALNRSKNLKKTFSVLVFLELWIFVIYIRNKFMSNKIFPSYPKVYNLGHPAIKSILFDGSVQITEKIDGSQFSFGIRNGEIFCQSKNALIDINAPNDMFAKGVANVIDIFASNMKDGWIYRGEYLRRPKHNTITYNRTPKHNIILFDAQGPEPESYVRYGELLKIGEQMDLEVVPLLYEGLVTNPNDFMDLLNTESILGGSKIEGFVIKNYNQFDKAGKTAMAKIVCEEFKELNNKDFRKRNPSQTDILQTIGEQLRSEARWRKAIQHLAEQDALEFSPRDIGVLLKEISRDVYEEERELIVNKIMQWAWPKIRGNITRGFAEWYKNTYLVERQFDDDRE